VFALVFSPDGKRLTTTRLNVSVTANGGHRLRFWLGRHFPIIPDARLVNFRSYRHNPILLKYDGGTVVVTGGPDGFEYQSLPGVLFDPRTMSHRAQGRHYRAIVEQLIRDKIRYEDAARGWPAEQTGWKLNAERQPRDYQKAAVAAWSKTRRGVVVMPTGTGKTFTAFLCIEKVGRPTLVVTPKIDLMVQWAGELERAFGVEVGMVGAGVFEYRPLTVTTYDSAYIHLEKWANRFGW
jgi:hypothetical protein